MSVLRTKKIDQPPVRFPPKERYHVGWLLAVGVVLTIIAVAISGCAVNTGPVAIGDGTYTLTKQAGTGFGGMGTLGVDAVNEAKAECEKNGKTLELIERRDAEPPYVLGNYPRVDLIFRCI